MASNRTGPTRTSVSCAALVVLLAAAPAAAISPGLELMSEVQPFLLFAAGALGLVEAGRGSGRA
jgi:hypothetical protein